MRRVGGRFVLALVLPVAAMAATAAPAGAQTMTDALSQAYLTNPTLAAQRASMISHSGVPDKTTRE